MGTEGSRRHRRARSEQRGAPPTDEVDERPSWEHAPPDAPSRSYSTLGAASAPRGCSRSLHVACERDLLSLGVIAGHAVGLTPLVFLIAAVLFVLTALTYVEGASRPDRGGATVFARYALTSW